MPEPIDLLARALAVVRQEPAVSLATYSTVVQVANDTLPTTRQTMLQALLATSSSTIFGPVAASTTDIATATDYPTSSARRYLEELTAVKVGQWSADLVEEFEQVLAGRPRVGLALAFRRPVDQLTRIVREVVVK